MASHAFEEMAVLIAEVRSKAAALRALGCMLHRHEGYALALALISRGEACVGCDNY